MDQGEEFENNQDIESVVILITTSNSTVITYALWCWKEPIPRTDRTTFYNKTANHVSTFRAPMVVLRASVAYPGGWREVRAQLAAPLHQHHA
jgi:hypothetical protein